MSETPAPQGQDKVAEFMPWRCDVTGSPVGADTVKIGYVCQCQGCRAAAALESLQAENARLKKAAGHVLDAWGTGRNEPLEVAMPELSRAYFADAALAEPGSRSMSEFQEKLTKLLNYCSIDSESATPDYILAEYLIVCLTAFTTATRQRETWYGRPEPSVLKAPDLPLEPTDGG